jgi:hypothetical protein
MALGIFGIGRVQVVGDTDNNTGCIHLPHRQIYTQSSHVPDSVRRYTRSHTIDAIRQGISLSVHCPKIGHLPERQFCCILSEPRRNNYYFSLPVVLLLDNGDTGERCVK